MTDELKRIEEKALQEISFCAGNPTGLEELKIRYLGRKGILNDLFGRMATLSAAEKRLAGQAINNLKQVLAVSLDNAMKAVASSAASSREKIDITLPGISRELGHIHPITKTIQQICGIFLSLGFRVVEGPEIETEKYNFETLNIPLEHPSRDAFDTFYLKGASSQGLPPTRQGAGQAGAREKHLLRSHTSPVQTRFMEKNKPPFSIIVPGRVYRPDATDASHSFMFHQVEGLAVGDDIRFSDLKGVLSIFAKRVFGPEAKTRFRPSFFPFTEPSAEVDVSCIICRGQVPGDGGRGAGTEGKKKCSMCGGKGWLEIMGAGMVNPAVFENVGYNPKKLTGFAFGMGVERIAILKYGIPDIRMFFENDVRFLRQF